MKTRQVRMAILVILVFTALFSMILGMATLARALDQHWVYVIIGIDLIIVIISAVVLYVISADRHYWSTIDELEEELERFAAQREAYRKATIDMQGKQLQYFYQQGKKPDCGKSLLSEIVKKEFR